MLAHPVLLSCSMQYYTSTGYLLPTFHKQYHIGLRVQERPRFKWTDPYYSMGEGSYLHWGMEGSSPEPNNRSPPEDCGAATYMQMYGDAWGWSDVQCSKRLVFICKILRELELLMLTQLLLRPTLVMRLKCMLHSAASSSYTLYTGWPS